MGRTADYSRQSCSIAAALEVIGDPWTLLVIRDAFSGLRRFEQWQEHLGVARNVLAARLKTLVAHGILEPQVYSERPLRHEYVLTKKGKDLYAVILTLHGWGSKYMYGDGAGVAIVHKACGNLLDPGLACNCCGEKVERRDIELVKRPGKPVGEIMAELRAKEEAA
jgi:DNA-binding HxlR family transcriptional regulator